MNDEVERYWVKLIGQAQVILTGASDAELKVQLFDTLQEFFDGSNCWCEPIKFTVVPDYLEYHLVPLTGRILRLLGVVDQNSIAQQAVMPTIGVVRFLYPYTNVQPMTATVVKNVTDPFLCHPPHIPDWVLPVHGLGILNGLLGSMMTSAGAVLVQPADGAVSSRQVSRQHHSCASSCHQGEYRWCASLGVPSSIPGIGSAGWREHLQRHSANEVSAWPGRGNGSAIA